MPSDTRTASLLLVAGAVGVGWWWYHLHDGALASPAPAGGAADGGTAPATLGAKTAAVGSDLGRLEAFARSWGLTVTSGYRPGAKSLHGSGEAVDVAVPPAAIADQVKAAAAAAGIHVYPEVAGQVGANGSVSTGPHWHLSFPRIRNGRLVF